MMDISKELQYRRELKGLTQSELAREAHLSKGYLSDLESKPGKAVSAEILHRIATVLGTSMDRFFQVVDYCQRCGHTFDRADKHHIIHDDRYHITYTIGHACGRCAKEYGDIIERHDKEISDWVNGRSK